MSIFFFNDTATTEIYTLSLHDALPICRGCVRRVSAPPKQPVMPRVIVSRSSVPPSTSTSTRPTPAASRRRSEEHTSELQSRRDLVCRLLLEKKNTILSFL